MADIDYTSRRSIDAVGIPTHNRPMQMLRCISSFLANAQEFSRSPEYIVSDTSAGIAAQERQSKLSALAASWKVKIRYIDNDSREQWIRLLEKEGIRPEDLHFALEGDCTGFFDTCVGANRNAILLDTIGNNVLSVDDDTICTPFVLQTPDQSVAIRVLGNVDPTEMWFYPSRDDVLRQLGDHNLDVFDKHAQLLGSTVKQILADAAHEGARIDIGNACQHFLTTWQSGRIFITYNGIAGDSGMCLPPLSCLQKETQKRLNSHRSYKCARTSREVIRVAPHLSIAHEAAFSMTTFAGFHNKELLPPFNPVGRNEDSLFALLVRICYDDAYSAHLPFALFHAPPEMRRYPKDSIGIIACPRHADIVRVCLSMFDSGDIDIGAASRLGRVGEHLIEVGSLPTPEFMTLIRKRWLALLSHMAASIRHRLEHSKSMVAMAINDLEGVYSRIITLGKGSESVVPYDISCNGYEPSDVMGIAQMFVRKYGQLLKLWPDIVRATSHLNHGGFRLSRPV